MSDAQAMVAANEAFIQAWAQMDDNEQEARVRDLEVTAPARVIRLPDGWRWTVSYGEGPNRALCIAWWYPVEGPWSYAILPPMPNGALEPWVFLYDARRFDE